MKDDITRRASVKAAKRMSGAIGRLKVAIPFGPDTVQMNESELAASLKKSPGDVIMQFIDQLGSERALDIMRKQRGNKETNQA